MGDEIYQWSDLSENFGTFIIEELWKNEIGKFLISTISFIRIYKICVANFKFWQHISSDLSGKFQISALLS